MANSAQKASGTRRFIRQQCRWSRMKISVTCDLTDWQSSFNDPAVILWKWWFCYLLAACVSKINQVIANSFCLLSNFTTNWLEHIWLSCNIGKIDLFYDLDVMRSSKHKLKTLTRKFKSVTVTSRSWLMGRVSDGANENFEQVSIIIPIMNQVHHMAWK